MDEWTSAKILTATYDVIKYEISGCNRVAFLGYRLHWSSSFFMAQLFIMKLAALAFMYCGEFVQNPYYIFAWVQSLFVIFVMNILFRL